VESCFAVCCRSFEEPEGFDTVGQFLPGFKTRVVDEQGDDIPPKKEQKGQLLVSGASVARTYWEDKENTKMNMRGQWFFTGDHVEVDKKGHVKFLDRKENVFRVVDEVIYPGPIEKKLLEIPGIEMASVIMLKDAVGKPMVTAFLKKRTGAEISTTDLNKFCEANLSERQRPRSFAFIDDPPVDSRGLINNLRIFAKKNFC
jgi:long-chain acyl-CoA synthetase